MKDQKHNQGGDHAHEGHSNKGQSSSQKVDAHGETQKGSHQQHTQGRETPGREGSEQADRAAKTNSSQRGREFGNLDHDKIAKFHEDMDKDEGLKQRFQQDPHGVLEEHGVNIPEGYKATYDHQFVKPSDGSKVGMYGYRVGNINFTK